MPQRIPRKVAISSIEKTSFDMGICENFSTTIEKFSSFRKNLGSIGLKNSTNTEEIIVQAKIENPCEAPCLTIYPPIIIFG